MGAIADVIAAIEEEVIAALAAASYPPLSDGEILVGTAALFEQSAAPRIIFEPVGSSFGTAEYASASATLDTPERQRQNAMRTIAAEDMFFNVRCWGAAVPGPTVKPVDDYDVTRALYHAVRAALHKRMPGAYKVEESGKYPASSNIIRSGREFVFGVTFLTPVLESLLPYDRARLYAPDDVVAEGTDSMTIPTTGPTTGPSETGC